MKIYRPLVNATSIYCVGLLTMHFYKDYPLIVFLICILVGLIMYSFYKSSAWKGFLVFFLVFLISIVIYHTNDLVYYNKSKLILSEDISIKGEITKILKVKNNNTKVFHLKDKNNLEIICYYNDNKDIIAPGNIYEIKGVVQIPEKQRNPGGFNEEKYYKINNWNFKMYAEEVYLLEEKYNLRRMLFLCKSSLEDSFNKILPKEQSAIIKTMLLGGNYEDTEDIKELFKKAGIIHILAISGLHVTMIGWLIFKMLSKTILPKRVGYIITILILFLYCMMTGFSTATTRALLMFSIFFVGSFLGRKTDMYTSIAFTALIILITNPYMLFDMGFQLSFSAVISIVTLTPLLEKLIPNSTVSKYICASISAFLGTWPIIAYNYYYLTTYSVIINIIIVPMVSVLLLIGFTGGVIGIFSTFLGKMIIGASYFIMKIYEFLANFFTSLPYAIINTGKPSIVFIISYYLVLGFLVYVVSNNLFYNKRIFARFCLIFGVMILLLPKRNNTVTYLDVGQGDCAVINTINNSTYIIDGGGEGRYPVGKNTLHPYLKYLGVNEVDGIFLSHSDKDHITGLIEIVDMIDVKTIYIANRSIQENEYLFSLLEKARENNIEVVELSNGHYLQEEELIIQCLEPSKDLSYPSNNDSSMVVGIKIDEISFLFTGDIEEFGERQLLSNKIERYDILKVPHHGSKTSTSQLFLDIIKPKISVISCGVDNKYGHPHKEVLKRLEKNNIKIYNTADDGAVIITINNNELQIKSWLRE